MAKAPNPYRRLPGTGRGAFETVRLYAAEDHLIQVSSSGFTETYRRFYFRDIQAITVRVSMHGKVWNGIAGFLAFIFAIIALQVGLSAAPFWWGVIAVLLLLGVNVALGPTCVCEVSTAVQTRPLASLRRVRRAVSVIAQIRSLIEAEQEALPREEIARRIDEARRGPAVAPGPVMATDAGAAPPAT